MALAFRRIPESKNDIDNYVVCHMCIIEFLVYTEYTIRWLKFERTTNGVWNRDLQQNVPNNFIPFDTQGMPYTCWKCHCKIIKPEYPEPFVVKKKYNKYRQISKWRPDTRRVSASGKIIGNVNCTSWGESRGMGRYCRRRLHKAERQYDKLYAKSYIQDPEDISQYPEKEPKVNSRRLSNLNSMVSWRND